MGTTIKLMGGCHKWNLQHNDWIIYFLHVACFICAVHVATAITGTYSKIWKVLT